MAKVLALDVGERKIGVAVGQTDQAFAFARPALLVENWEQAWQPLKKIVADEGIERVILGLPLQTDGRLGPQAARVREFGQHLAQTISQPIEYRDERLTTQAVQREQQAAGMHLTRGQEDSLAAQLLLESYLTEQA